MQYHIENVVSLCYYSRPQTSNVQDVGVGPLENEIDFGLLIIRSLSIEYHRIYKKNYAIILYFCTFLRRFTKETSYIAESCKLVECLEKMYIYESKSKK